MAYIDFHDIRPDQVAVHERLINWARWSVGRGSDNTAPMFRLYRSSARARSAYGATASPPPIDVRDALAIQRRMVDLPAPQRQALSWAYLRPVHPRRAAEEIGTTIAGLATLLELAREALTAP